MIVDFENNPKNSIIYTSSIILTLLNKNNGKMNFNDLYNYCKNNKMEYSIFILTIDWMYLVELIKEINEKNEVILCN